MFWQICAYLGLVVEVIGMRIARKSRIGWYVTLLGAVLWSVYAVGLHLWPNLASTTIFGSVYVSNLISTSKIYYSKRRKGKYKDA